MARSGHATANGTLPRNAAAKPPNARQIATSSVAVFIRQGYLGVDVVTSRCGVSRVAGTSNPRAYRLHTDFIHVVNCDMPSSFMAASNSSSSSGLNRIPLRYGSFTDMWRFFQAPNCMQTLTLQKVSEFDAVHTAFVIDTPGMHSSMSQAQEAAELRRLHSAPSCARRQTIRGITGKPDFSPSERCLHQQPGGLFSLPCSDVTGAIGSHANRRRAGIGTGNRGSKPRRSTTARLSSVRNQELLNRAFVGDSIAVRRSASGDPQNNAVSGLDKDWDARQGGLLSVRGRYAGVGKPIRGPQSAKAPTDNLIDSVTADQFKSTLFSLSSCLRLDGGTRRGELPGREIGSGKAAGWQYGLTVPLKGNPVQDNYQHAMLIVAAAVREGASDTETLRNVLRPIYEVLALGSVRPEEMLDDVIAEAASRGVLPWITESN